MLRSMVDDTGSQARTLQVKRKSENARRTYGRRAFRSVKLADMTCLLGVLLLPDVCYLQREVLLGVRASAVCFFASLDDESSKIYWW